MNFFDPDLEKLINPFNHNLFIPVLPCKGLNILIDFSKKNIRN